MREDKGKRKDNGNEHTNKVKRDLRWIPIS